MPEVSVDRASSGCARIDRYHSFVCRRQTTTNHWPIKRQVIAENDTNWCPMKQNQYIEGEISFWRQQSWPTATIAFQYIIICTILCFLRVLYWTSRQAKWMREKQGKLNWLIIIIERRAHSCFEVNFYSRIACVRALALLPMFTTAKQTHTRRLIVYSVDVRCACKHHLPLTWRLFCSVH